MRRPPVQALRARYLQGCWEHIEATGIPIYSSQVTGGMHAGPRTTHHRERAGRKMTRHTLRDHGIGSTDACPTCLDAHPVLADLALALQARGSVGDVSHHLDSPEPFEPVPRIQERLGVALTRANALTRRALDHDDEHGIGVAAAGHALREHLESYRVGASAAQTYLLGVPVGTMAWASELSWDAFAQLNLHRRLHGDLPYQVLSVPEDLIAMLPRSLRAEHALLLDRPLSPDQRVLLTQALGPSLDLSPTPTRETLSRALGVVLAATC